MTNPAYAANLTKFHQRASELKRGIIFTESKYKKCIFDESNELFSRINIINCLDVGYFIFNYVNNNNYYQVFNYFKSAFLISGVKISTIINSIMHISGLFES